jgi:hypothetical protein
MPPQILVDQKAPPAAAAGRITACPPRFLDFGTCLKNNLNSKVLNNRVKHVCKNIFYISYSRNILQEGFLFSFYRVKFACKKLSSYLGKKFEIKQDLLQLKVS